MLRPAEPRKQAAREMEKRKRKISSSSFPHSLHAVVNITMFIARVKKKKEETRCACEERTPADEIGSCTSDITK